MKGAAIVALAALTCAAPAQAQIMDANLARIAHGECVVQGVAISPEFLQVATDIVDMTDHIGRMTTALQMAATGAMVDRVQQSPPIDDPTARRFEAAVLDELAAHIDVFVKAEACVYAQHYTADELHQLRDFYRTPLGQKLISQAPDIMADFVGVGIELHRTDLVAHAVDAARAKLRAEGVKL
jgi:hypothetical protein